MILAPFIVPLGVWFVATALISVILYRKEEKLRRHQKLFLLGLVLSGSSLFAFIALLNWADVHAPHNSEGIMIVSGNLEIAFGAVMLLMFSGPACLAYAWFAYKRHAQAARIEHSEIVKVISSEYDVDEAVEIIERAGHNKKLKADTEPL